VGEPVVACRMDDGGVQIGALGIHPGHRLFAGGQIGHGRWHPIGWRAAGRVSGQLAVRSLSCGGVIVQQPADGPVLVAGRVGGGKGAGVIAEQIVETVPPAGRFLDQVNREQGIELGARLADAEASEGGGGVDNGSRWPARYEIRVQIVTP
jgi:hypothetical protein